MERKGDSKLPAVPGIEAEARDAFLAGLRAGVRQEDAARAAGWSMSSFYKLRRADRAFAAAWAEAHAFSAEEERRDGGTVRYAANNGRRIQRRKMRHVLFDEERQQCFLGHFAGTCDTREAAAVAGVDESTVYKHRLRNPDFAALWNEALDQGYARLEAEALRQRLEAQRRLSEGLLPTGEIAQEFERVMKLLARWDRGRGEPPGPRRISHGKQAGSTFEEAIEALDKKLRALDIPIVGEP
jgi:hypothetical protein